MRFVHRLLYLTRKSLATHGVGKTAALCLTRPFFYLVRNFNSQRLQRLRRERAFDRQFGVDTSEGNIFSYVPDTASSNWLCGNGYQPSPAHVFREIMRELSVPFEKSIFIDFGSGKGLTLLLASEYPFKRIIGVEYCKSLHATAQQNVAKYHSPTIQCRDVQPICADAAAFPIPFEPAVLYFYNPFDDALMSHIAKLIEGSWAARPRKLIVIYYNPVHGDAFRRSGFWKETINKTGYVFFESP